MMKFAAMTTRPPNETDQLHTQHQWIEGWAVRWVKIYVGQELDAWLDNDDHLEQWEENTLTASDRRILLANWYNTAVKRALEGQAKLKYFEHAGCLLAADGSNDDLVKFGSKGRSRATMIQT